MPTRYVRVPPHLRKRAPRFDWTPERDAVLRAKYDGRAGCVRRAAAALGVPLHVVIARAALLGLRKPRTTVQAWTEEETRFVRENAGSRSVVWIAKRLGRTVGAVTHKASRLKTRLTVTEGYTAEALTQCFGVGLLTVDRWIRQGWLRAERRNGGQGGPWLVSEAEVKRFVRTHPQAFRLERVDQTWFLDVVLGIQAEAV